VGLVKLLKIVLAVRKGLGKITDLLLKGRNAGLWNQGPKP
jgi:hypothetical protein